MRIQIPYVTMLLALACSQAHANLGGDADSILSDQTAWHAALVTATASGYGDYKLMLPDGIVVHEYLNAAGTVFEVSWAGRGHKPDMNRLLGAYASRADAAGRGVGPMQHRLDAVAHDMEVHAAVRNRFFSGTVHLPKALPASLAGPVPVGAR
jgi:hypothetical protein